MTDHQHEDNCLMCAVRALTEGDPPIWHRPEVGDKVSGVVLRTGIHTSNFGQTPFVDLWQGGHQRIRVVAYGQHLQHQIDSADAKIGDRLEVQREEDATFVSSNPNLNGRPYKQFSVTVQRGH